MKNLRNIVNQRREDLRKVVVGSIFRAGATVESMSPRDTGTFVANWMTGVNRVDLATTDDVTRSSVENLVGTLGSFVMGNTFYFTNNLPYAEALEYGHSEQAPLGMVRLVEKNIQRYVDDEVRKL